MKLYFVKAFVIIISYVNKNGHYNEIPANYDHDNYVVHTHFVGFF